MLPRGCLLHRALMQECEARELLGRPVSPKLRRVLIANSNTRQSLPRDSCNIWAQETDARLC